MSEIKETPGPLGYLAKSSVRNLGITFDSDQRLSHWIIEAISLAYSTKSLALPQDVRVHSTMGMETSWALFKGAMIFVL